MTRLVLILLICAQELSSMSEQTIAGTAQKQETQTVLSPYFIPVIQRIIAGYLSAEWQLKNEISFKKDDFSDWNHNFQSPFQQHLCWSHDQGLSLIYNLEESYLTLTYNEPTCTLKLKDKKITTTMVRSLGTLFSSLGKYRAHTQSIIDPATYRRIWNTVKITNYFTHQIQELAAPETPTEPKILQFSSENSHLAAAYHDVVGRVSVWYLKTKKRTDFTYDTSTPTLIALSPSGTHMAIFLIARYQAHFRRGEDKIVIYETVSQKSIREISGPFAQKPTALGFLPSRELLVGDTKGNIQCISLQSQEHPKLYSAKQETPIQKIITGVSNSIFASFQLGKLEDDGMNSLYDRINIWHKDLKTCLHTIDLPYVWAIVFSPSGSSLAIINSQEESNDRLTIWSSQEEELLTPLDNAK